MNKSLKALFMTSMLPVMMLMAAVTLTSCEGMLDDIFGEWSRPTGQQNNEPTKEELLSDLSSALEEGAIVTITYTIDGVEYTSTFKRVGEEYIEQSPAATRALHLVDGSNIENGHAKLSGFVELPSGNSKLNFEVYKDEEPQIDVTIDVRTCEQITKFATKGSGIENMLVNNKRVPQKGYYTESVLYRIVDGKKTYLGRFDHMSLDKWETVYGRSLMDNKHIQITNDKVYFTVGDYSGIITEYDTNKSVLPTDDIDESKTYYLKDFPPIDYQELSWDATKNEVVTNEQKVSNFSLVTSSNSKVIWSESTYVVNTDVTIYGGISLNGDVKLILCNGCTLTVNGYIYGDMNAFTIYGQAGGTDQEGTGKLSLTIFGHGIYSFSDFVIHGGCIEATSTNANINFNLKMYGGKFTAKSSGSAPTIDTYTDNNMTIYGGELEAISDNSNAISVGVDANPGTLTVYGGKVTASAPKGQAIKGKFAKGEGITDIVFSESDNGTEWTETAANVSDKRYFKAEEGVPTYNPTDEEINELYAKLVERTVMDKTVLSGMNIKLLVEDVAAETETITEAYAKPLAEKICTEKSLSGVVLFIGGDDTKGYDFYYMSGSTNGKTHLASTASIPAEWENLTLFYVKK